MKLYLRTKYFSNLLNFFFVFHVFNTSDWICTKQTRIHRCRLHKIWMEGERHIPTHCACGETNSMDHCLVYKIGGYTSLRHKSVRDSQAQIMREVYRDVQTEPTLLPINENDYERMKSQHCGQCKVISL